MSLAPGLGLRLRCWRTRPRSSLSSGGAGGASPEVTHTAVSARWMSPGGLSVPYHTKRLDLSKNLSSNSSLSEMKLCLFFF